MPRPPLQWSDPDGSIPHALKHADGNRFDAYVIYDGIGLDFGDAAEIYRRPGMLMPDYKRFVVEYPDGYTTERFKTMAQAERAIQKHYESH